MSPDLEATLIGYLAREMERAGLDAPVSGMVPSPRPPMFVRVRQTGGQASNLVTVEAEFTVECWADDDVTASNLARTAEAIALYMHGDVDGVWVRNVHSFGGVVNFPDPTSDNPRYQFAVVVNARTEPVPG